MKKSVFIMIIALIGLLIIVSALLLFQPQAPESEENMTIPNPIGTFEVSIENFNFNPNELKIAPGSTVVWINKDPLIHTITSDSGGKAELNSPLLDRAQVYEHTFTEKGVFDYHCNIRRSMKARIIVE